MDYRITECTKDYLSGGLMIAVGIGAMALGTTYHFGTLSVPGSGFFPVVLGVVLTLAGLGIAATARLSATKGALKVIPVEWKSWILIILSLTAFVVLGTYGGLLPATFAVVFISALADRQNTVKTGLLLAAAICVIAVVVFSWALQMQLPLFTWG